MKQLSFLTASGAGGPPSEKKRWKLFVDGASRNNPGLAGAGICLLDAHDKPVVKDGFFVGTKTNNQAEYLALLLGIFFAQQHIAEDDILAIHADSELLVKQLQGEYRIKNPELKKLYNIAFRLLKPIRYTIVHVLRDKNTVADAMANRGIKEKKEVPNQFLELLTKYGVSL